jgi:hypothetical protein
MFVVNPHLIRIDVILIVFYFCLHVIYTYPYVLHFRLHDLPLATRASGFDRLFWGQLMLSVLDLVLGRPQGLSDSILLERITTTSNLASYSRFMGLWSGNCWPGFWIRGSILVETITKAADCPRYSTFPSYSSFMSPEVQRSAVGVFSR